MNGQRWLKRIAIVTLATGGALVTGSYAARLVLPADASEPALDPVASSVRSGLGRDLAADEAARKDRVIGSYTPGERRIDDSSIAGARALDPYEPTLSKVRKARGYGGDGNYFESAIKADHSYLDEPPAGERRAAARDASPAQAWDNGNSSPDMDSALAQ